MRDSRLIWLSAVSCRPSVHSCGLSRLCVLAFEAMPPWRELFAIFFIPSNNKPKSRNFSAILRQNGAFIKILSGISGHFRALSWREWVTSSSFLRKYSHFTWQSAYAHPPLGHFRTFLPVRGILRKLVAVFRALRPIDPRAALSPTLRQCCSISHFALQRSMGRAHWPTRRRSPYTLFGPAMI